jgi:cell division septation protein DedD
MFSVPIISRLEAGKQYVQIGAFTRPDTLETAVAQANRGYPLAIQTGGSNNTLVYRLLIGPLNAGESAAVLQRVKNRGFPDAFIRIR